MTNKESSSYRDCCSKKTVTKVMFLVAVARSRFDEDRDVLLDRKLGLWLFVEEVPAKRSPENGPKGTLELKPVNVDRYQYKRMLLENVIPTITRKWPGRKT